MTGFGNFIFFTTKRDFSLTRVVQMLWRLNMFVVLLCWSQDNNWLLYYICPLHTFHFFLTYAVCGSAHFMTSRIKHAGLPDHAAYPMTIGCFVVFIAVTWSSPVYNTIWWFVQTEPMIGATYGAA